MSRSVLGGGHCLRAVSAYCAPVAVCRDAVRFAPNRSICTDPPGDTTGRFTVVPMSGRWLVVEVDLGAVGPEGVVPGAEMSDELVHAAAGWRPVRIAR